MKNKTGIIMKSKETKMSLSPPPPPPSSSVLEMKVKMAKVAVNNKSPPLSFLAINHHPHPQPHHNHHYHHRRFRSLDHHRSSQPSRRLVSIDKSRWSLPLYSLLPRSSFLLSPFCWFRSSLPNMMMDSIVGTATKRPLMLPRMMTMTTTVALLLLIVSLVTYQPIHALASTSSDEMLDNLDQYVCLRANGFFPHDIRCDHFYECRNATIINEGICKQGLRFDYRYRKKPRCIASDLIDCRITQVDLMISVTPPLDGGGNGNTGSSPSFVPTTSSFSAATVTPSSPSSPSSSSSRANKKSSSLSSLTPAAIASMTTTTPTTTQPPTTTTPPPPTTAYITTTTTTSFPSTFPVTSWSRQSHQSPSSSSGHRNRNRAQHQQQQQSKWKLHKQLEDEYIRNNSPESSIVNDNINVDNIDIDDNDNSAAAIANANHHANHRENANDDDDEYSDNVLTKKRKLLRKPVKLRRGHLQESLPPSSSSASAIEANSRNDMLLSRTIDSLDSSTADSGSPYSSSSTSSRHSSSSSPSSSNSLLSPSTPTRPKSIHCPQLSGYYADREDCRKFYACDDGRAFPMSCPLGLAYDELTGTCNWPDMVEGCRSEEMLRFTCPEPYENDILDYGDPRYPTSDCRKFVVCVLSDLYGTRTPRLLGCEEGLVFNPDTRNCDYPENVPTCANYYDDVGNGGGSAQLKFRRAQLKEGSSASSSTNTRKRRVRH